MRSLTAATVLLITLLLSAGCSNTAQKANRAPITPQKAGSDSAVTAPVAAPVNTNPSHLLAYSIAVQKLRKTITGTEDPSSFPEQPTHTRVDNDTFSFAMLIQIWKDSDQQFHPVDCTVQLRYKGGNADAAANWQLLSYTSQYTKHQPLK